MSNMTDYVLAYYDEDVVRRIAEKYCMEPLEAARQFLTSQTHAMLEDAACEMWMFSPRAIFDMWEAERVTGDPRNSSYIKGE